ncbi:phosphonate ABC transporter, permease protein PhnE [Streptomyces viridochromogenes]|uniref:phosphonate ABC transporter, permease protein PhnE n=1 Tax=Streptomyces viridochromogenes TaxID=1938 RepID=UPI00099B6646|nr:phosphonate ABC transporter, permease protein PhnE [Streptomyces viridochromogenes]
MSSRTQTGDLKVRTASVGAAPGPRTGAAARALPHLTLLALAVTACWAVVDLRINIATLVDGAHNAVDFTGRMLPLDFPPLAELVRLAGESLSIAVCATLMSLVLSVPVSMLAARNITSNAYARGGARGVIVLARAIPDVIMAIAAVRVFGLGATAGVVAMGLHSVGMVGKLYADSLEEVDEGPRRALRAAGASRPQELVAAVLPQVLPAFIATALHRLDINLRGSVLLGFVGVGGIGFEIAQSFQRLDYRRGMALAVVVLALCLAMELLSGTVRHAILRGAVQEGKARRNRLTSRLPGRGRGRDLGRGTAVNGTGAPAVRTSVRPGGSPPWPLARVRRWTYAVVTVVVLWACVRGAELSATQLAAGLADLPSVLGQYLPPTAPGGLEGLFDALWVTVKTALAGTVLGMVLAVPVGVLAARNTSPSPRVSRVFRTLTVAVRGIPEVVLAIVLVVVTGLGPVAGALALAVGSLGLLGKLVADSLEELDPGPARSLVATGASRGQVFFAAVLPQALPALAGHTLYQLDVNIRAATLLGVVGAGGIGFELLNAARVLEFGLVTTIVLMLLTVTLITEAFAMWIRRVLA